jgi:hypothetical protein
MAKEGDLLLVHVEDNPAFFARVECISPDAKPGWYQVDLLILQVPLVEITWILREEYIEGASFTMGEKKVCLEVVQTPGKRPPPEQDRLSEEDERKEPSEKGAERGKVISLFDRG